MWSVDFPCIDFLRLWFQRINLWKVLTCALTNLNKFGWPKWKAANKLFEQGRRPTSTSWAFFLFAMFKSSLNFAVFARTFGIRRDCKILREALKASNYFEANWREERKSWALEPGWEQLQFVQGWWALDPGTRPVVSAGTWNNLLQFRVIGISTPGAKDQGAHWQDRTCCWRGAWFCHCNQPAFRLDNGSYGQPGSKSGIQMLRWWMLLFLASAVMCIQIMMFG